LRSAGRQAAVEARRAWERSGLQELRSGVVAPAATEWENPEQSRPGVLHPERPRASEPAAVWAKPEPAGLPVKPQLPWAAESMEFPAAVLLVRTAVAAAQSPQLGVAGDGAPAVLERPCWPELKEPGGALGLPARAWQVHPPNVMDGPASVPVQRLRSRSKRRPELQRVNSEVLRVFRALEPGGLWLRQEAAVAVETAWEDVPAFQALRAWARLRFQEELQER
jgi:hypothetical protein